MSGGGSQNQTTTVQNPPWLDQASQAFLGSAGGLYGSGGTPNANQTGAWNTAAGWGAMAPSALGIAGNTMAANAGYQFDPSWLGPLAGLLGSNVSSGGMSGAGGGMGAGAIPSFGGRSNPRNYDPANASASTVDTSQLGNVDPRSFTDYNINDYLNPYTSSVIDASNADNERARQLAQGNDAAQAIGAGAYGGSRSGVVSALTNSEYDRNAQSADASMRNQAFNTASGLIQNDQGLDLQGQLANANALNTALGLNAQLGTQTSLANAAGANSLTGDRIGADATRDAANAAAGASMYGSSLNAQNNRLSTLINGALGLGQLGIGGELNAATLRGNSATGLQSFGAGGLNAQGGAGDSEYALPYDNANWYSGILGNIPHGQVQSSPLYQNRGAGALGGAATGASVGSNFGPWGTAIGAVGGGLMGYFG